MNALLVGLPLYGAPGLIELLIIGGAIFLFFGATKLPKLGRGLGEGIRNFKSGLGGNKKETREDSTAPSEIAEANPDDPSSKE